MPLWKYIANRGLTLIENSLLGAKLSEYHTRYRTFSKHLLEKLPSDIHTDDFVFDNQMLVQILWYGYTVAEISCPTKYFTKEKQARKHVPGTKTSVEAHRYHDFSYQLV